MPQPVKTDERYESLIEFSGRILYVLQQSLYAESERTGISNPGTINAQLAFFAVSAGVDNDDWVAILRASVGARDSFDEAMRKNESVVMQHGS